MSLEPTPTVYVFFSYAHQDKALRDKLEDHLSNLKYRGLISTWHDREISAGTEWAQQIDIHLNTADIILLLISSSFMASEYCYSIEMKRALERHEREEARVLPILLRPVLFTDAPFAKLQFLPRNAIPVVNWRNRDSAFVDIALGVERVIRERKLFTFIDEFMQSFSVLGEATVYPSEDSYYTETYYTKTYTAYQQAVLLNYHDSEAHRGMGNALYSLGNYFETISAFERAQRNYFEAISAFDTANTLKPTASACCGIGRAYSKLKKYNWALEAYERAIELDPTFASAYAEMSETLKQLGRSEEAQHVLEKAKQLGYEE